MLDKFKNMGWKKFYLIYAMCTLGTMATRFLPFMIFNEKEDNTKVHNLSWKGASGSYILNAYCVLP